MILSVIQSSHGDLHHLLDSVKNGKRDVLRRKSATLAVRRLLRGRVLGCWDLWCCLAYNVFLLTLLFHIFFFYIINWCGNYKHFDYLKPKKIADLSCSLFSF